MQPSTCDLRNQRDLATYVSFSIFIWPWILRHCFFYFLLYHGHAHEPLLATAHCLGIQTEDPHEDVHVCWFLFKAVPLDVAVVAESQCPLATLSRAMSNVKGWA